MLRGLAAHRGGGIDGVSKIKQVDLSMGLFMLQTSSTQVLADEATVSGPHDRTRHAI
jgi:hypothetical protein